MPQTINIALTICFTLSALSVKRFDVILYSFKNICYHAGGLSAVVMTAPPVVYCLYIIVIGQQHTSSLAFNISDIIVLKLQVYRMYKIPRKTIKYSYMNGVHMYVVLLY